MSNLSLSPEEVFCVMIVIIFFGSCLFLLYINLRTRKSFEAQIEKEKNILIGKIVLVTIVTIPLLDNSIKSEAQKIMRTWRAKKYAYKQDIDLLKKINPVEKRALEIKKKVLYLTVRMAESSSQEWQDSYEDFIADYLALAEKLSILYYDHRSIESLLQK